MGVCEHWKSDCDGNFGKVIDLGLCVFVCTGKVTAMEILERSLTSGCGYLCALEK